GRKPPCMGIGSIFMPRLLVVWFLVMSLSRCLLLWPMPLLLIIRSLVPSARFSVLLSSPLI
ncbi:hypothetical protein A2U01_0082968, partial [Trifolium medium]|nr:hypothetical protein [Trifolium medium]